jgi:hypothetical protein
MKNGFLVKYLPVTLSLLILSATLQAQPISGVWKGKMGASRIELKLVRKGDSLIGTSYYYDSRSNYRRYSVKGYFDGQTNDVIWWDDQLIEDNSSHHFSGNGTGALLAVADFNCPGEGIMKLDGNSTRKDDNQKDKKELHLVKADTAPIFPDEWDFLIANYVYSVMHPELIDSVEQVALIGMQAPATETAKTSVPAGASSTSLVPASTDRPAMEKLTEATLETPVENRPQPLPPPIPRITKETNEERFTSRRKILQHVIPVKGDSIELRFYDNAEIDGDSIAVFLNGRLLQEHILLAEQAYIIKIAVADLQQDNELVMVAENLGTIPPNTSLMVAVVEDKRYEAHLESSEGSSALVRLVKP